MVLRNLLLASLLLSILLISCSEEKETQATHLNASETKHPSDTCECNFGGLGLVADVNAFADMHKDLDWLYPLHAGEDLQTNLINCINRAKEKQTHINGMHACNFKNLDPEAEFRFAQVYFLNDRIARIVLHISDAMATSDYEGKLSARFGEPDSNFVRHQFSMKHEYKVWKNNTCQILLDRGSHPSPEEKEPVNLSLILEVFPLSHHLPEEYF